MGAPSHGPPHGPPHGPLRQPPQPLHQQVHLPCQAPKVTPVTSSNAQPVCCADNPSPSLKSLARYTIMFSSCYSHHRRRNNSDIHIGCADKLCHETDWIYDHIFCSFVSLRTSWSFPSVAMSQWGHKHQGLVRTATSGRDVQMIGNYLQVRRGTCKRLYIFLNDSPLWPL